MEDPIVPEAGIIPANPRANLGSERLLGVPEVRQMTGLGEVSAAKLMKESGCCIRLHRRLYVLESSFFSFLHQLEVTQPCAL